MTDLQKQQITEMRESGIGYGQIAITLQISESAVKSFCRRHLNVKQPLVITETLHADCCKRCGEKLINTPGHRQKTFCSSSCQQKYWWKNRALMQHPSFVTNTCPVCGQIFSDYAGHKRKYCSHACYITDRYRKGETDETDRNNLSCHHEAIPKNASTGLADSKGIR